MFLEEPVWPPEDFATLAEVRTKGGLDIAAGENACTAHQFRQMMKAGAVSHAQPSVTKVGGITEYLKVVALADELGVRLAPHSPYFGPGLLATLQLLSLRDDGTFVEMFYMKRAACLWRGRIDVDANGNVEVPRRTRARLRAGQRGHGAIPGVVTRRIASFRSASDERSFPRNPLRRSLRRLLVAGILGRRRRLLHLLVSLLLRRLQIVDDLLQARHGAFRASICRLAASSLLLMVDAEFRDGLLQKIDIALQAAGAPLHGLFDGADFDAGNVLCVGARRNQHAGHQP